MTYAVDAGAIGLGFVGMAAGTIRQGQGTVVDELLDAGVTVHAGKPGVDRLLKGCGRKNQ